MALCLVDIQYPNMRHRQGWHRDGSTSVLGSDRPDQPWTQEQIGIQPTHTESLELKPMWIRRMAVFMKAETEPIHSQEGNPNWKNREESRQLTTNKNGAPNCADLTDLVRSC
jgi:hypothetical protein